MGGRCVRWTTRLSKIHRTKKKKKKKKKCERFFNFFAAIRRDNLSIFIFSAVRCRSCMDLYDSVINGHRAWRYRGHRLWQFSCGAHNLPLTINLQQDCNLRDTRQFFQTFPAKEPRFRAFPFFFFYVSHYSDVSDRYSVHREWKYNILQIYDRISSRNTNISRAAASRLIFKRVRFTVQLWEFIVHYTARRKKEIAGDMAGTPLFSRRRLRYGIIRLRQFEPAESSR